MLDAQESHPVVTTPDQRFEGIKKDAHFFCIPIGLCDFYILNYVRVLTYTNFLIVFIN